MFISSSAKAIIVHFSLPNNSGVWILPSEVYNLFLPADLSFFNLAEHIRPGSSVVGFLRPLLFLWLVANLSR